MNEAGIRVIIEHKKGSLNLARHFISQGKISEAKRITAKVEQDIRKIKRWMKSKNVDKKDNS